MSSIRYRLRTFTISRYPRFTSSISMLWHSIFYSRFLLHINANSWKYISRRHERGMNPITKLFHIYQLSVVVWTWKIKQKKKSLKSYFLFENVFETLPIKITNIFKYSFIFLHFLTLCTYEENINVFELKPNGYL